MTAVNDINSLVPVEKVHDRTRVPLTDEPIRIPPGVPVLSLLDDPFVPMADRESILVQPTERGRNGP
eukprot:5011188-Pyramimonas_sp.AAC.1